MLSRAILLLAGAVTFLGATTGCTGLTKPDSISIVAEPAPEAAAPKPAGQAQAAAPQRPAPTPAPAQANCGE